jgi:hypothetical protein
MKAKGRSPKGNEGAIAVMAKQNVKKSPVSLAGLLDLGDCLFQGDTSQNRIAISGIVSSTPIKLLQKPRHSHCT